MRFLIHFIICCSTIFKAEKPEQTIDSYVSTYSRTRPSRKPVNQQSCSAPSSIFYARSSALVKTHDKIRRTARPSPKAGPGGESCPARSLGVIPAIALQFRSPASAIPKLLRLLRQNMQRARNRLSTPTNHKKPHVCSMLQNRTLRRVCLRVP